MKSYSVRLVKEDGTELIVDGVVAKNKQEASNRAHFYTPPMWANCQEVKHYIDGELILGNW
jgi:hypothetical protein